MAHIIVGGVLLSLTGYNVLTAICVIVMLRYPDTVVDEDLGDTAYRPMPASDAEASAVDSGIVRFASTDRS
jgi:hypothetical protein